MESFAGLIQSGAYDELANHLVMEGSERSPSYVHGGICGIYAAAGAVSAEDCLAASAQALQDEEFAFHLLLPDEDTDIGERVQALAEWCRGFLAAYALVISHESGTGLDSDTGESLADIAAIAEATVDAEADEEESESHLFEVSEYLRFATLNLFMGRQDANEPDPVGTDPRPTRGARP